MVQPISGDIGSLLLSFANTQNGIIDQSLVERGSRLGAKSNYVPMIITTDYRVTSGFDVNTASRNRRHLLFWAGPKSVEWNFTQRGSMQQSRTGHIAHFWRDSKRGTFFDNPSINFTFQTGNLMPIRETNSTLFLDPFPPGLLDYYEFFSLLDEQKILSDGRPNYVNIIYHSLLYPTILLRGFFEPETAMTVREEAGKPASIEWNATFRLKESNPVFSESSKLVAAWQDAVNGAKYNNELQQIIAAEEQAQRDLIIAPFHDKIVQEEIAASNAELAAQKAKDERQERNRFVNFVRDNFDGDPET
jgi:hypothetical protein